MKPEGSRWLPVTCLGAALALAAPAMGHQDRGGALALPRGVEADVQLGAVERAHDGVPRGGRGREGEEQQGGEDEGAAHCGPAFQSVSGDAPVHGR